MTIENLDCIYIKNFACPASIGIYPHEKIAPQPLIFHLEAYGKWTETDFLDYDKIIAYIQTVLAEQHYELLESLVNKIAECLLTHFPVQKLVLAIDKPNAVKNALVGVKIERTA